MKLPKTITIDAKQYNAAFKSLYGRGRAADRFDTVARYALLALDKVVNRLSKGYQFIDGKWIGPEKKP